VKAEGVGAVEVAAALVFRDGKLLIARRPIETYLGGLWEFPGGKREPGESFEECLHRELHEELAIEVQVRDLVEALTHEYPDRTVHLRFFRCRWLRREPKAAYGQEVAWITAEDLGKYEFPAADERLLERLRKDWRQLAEGE
jgi:8-oxo-dGTP diphosphatase